MRRAASATLASGETVTGGSLMISFTMISLTVASRLGMASSFGAFPLHPRNSRAWPLRRKRFFTSSNSSSSSVPWKAKR